LQQPAQIASRLARILALALLAWTVEAGSLGFQDLGLVEVEKVVADCGSCAFVTSFETIPPPSDPSQLVVTIVFSSLLWLIGIIGLRLRVRTR